MPAIVFVMLMAALASGCDILESTSSVTPTPVRTLVINGPSTLDVGATSPFTASWRSADNTSTPATDVRWSVSRPELLSLTAQGFATGLKVGFTDVRASSGVDEASRSVSVAPKIVELIVAGLPDRMNVGSFADLEVTVIADVGNGNEFLKVADVLGTTNAAAIQWSSQTQTTLSVSESVARAGLGIARALAPGAGRVQATVAGLVATGTTQIVGVTTTVPVTPPASPGDLNDAYSFGLVRGAGDCGLGLRDRIDGSLDIDGVPSSGLGGRARLNYGTIYDWLQLQVVLAGSSEFLDFESETVAAAISGYQVYISGRLYLRDRNGYLKFYWVRIGQPKSSACAVFEGSLGRRR